MDERVKRINELAQKSRTVGLTEEEKAQFYQFLVRLYKNLTGGASVEEP